MFYINHTKAFGYSQVDDDILERILIVRIEPYGCSRTERTIGSCEMGRAEISTSGSGPTPAASMVHASLLSDTQDMYWASHHKWLLILHGGISGRTASSNPGLYSKP